jgi:hypothetical protein
MVASIEALLQESQLHWKGPVNRTKDHRHSKIALYGELSTGHLPKITLYGDLSTGHLPKITLYGDLSIGKLP